MEGHLHYVITYSCRYFFITFFLPPLPSPPQAAGQMLKLYSMMLEKDATMIEINPMVETLDPSGQKRG